MFLPQLSLPLQLGFVELGTTFEKETLLAQFGLHLFACRGWIPVLCLHLFLLAEIGYPFSYFVSICFYLFSLRDWIPVLLFWMHLFASVWLVKIRFWYQNVAAASRQCRFLNNSSKDEIKSDEIRFSFQVGIFLKKMGNK